MNLKSLFLRQQQRRNGKSMINMVDDDLILVFESVCEKNSKIG